VENLAAEGTEVFGPAVGVGAVDAGNTYSSGYLRLGTVSTFEKALDGFGDTLQARVSQSARAVDLVASTKLGEVVVEQPLQRAGDPLPLSARGCGLKLEGLRVGHTMH